MNTEKKYPWGQNQNVDSIDYQNVPDRLWQADYQVVLIAGPNGVGKGTVIRKLINSNPTFSQVARETTKPLTTEDIESLAYHQVATESFLQTVATKEFIEWGKYGQGLYGTAFSSIVSALEKGTVVVIDVDLDGGVVLRDFFGKLGVSVHDCFISPISEEELVNENGIDKALDIIRQRLISRGRRESGHELEGRVTNARSMFQNFNKFRYVVSNTEGNITEAAESILRMVEESTNNLLLSNS